MDTASAPELAKMTDTPAPRVYHTTSLAALTAATGRLTMEGVSYRVTRRRRGKTRLYRLEVYTDG